MKVRIALGLACALAISCLQAQSVTIQNESVDVEYYQLPQEPLDPSYTTYSADLVVPSYDFSKSGLSRSSLQDQYLRLEGYKESSGKGDVRFTASIGEFTIWGEHRKTSTTKSKDKDGVERTKTNYSIELRYSMALSWELENRDGRTIGDEYVFSHGDIKSWFSPTYSSLSGLEDYWRIQKPNRVRELQEGMIKDGLKSAYNRVNYLYGYPIIKASAKFETIGKKKHPDYDMYEANMEKLKAAFALVRANKPIDEAREKMKPVLSYFIEKAQKYQKGGSKDDEKLRHLCYYNLALAYYWLELPEEAESWAQKILRFDAKDKDAKRLMEDIDELRSAFSRTGRTTRHNVVIGKA